MAEQVEHVGLTDAPTDAPADVLIVGAGISGSEAAYACARAGLSVLLVTTTLDTVYNLAQDGVVLAPPPGTLMAQLTAEGGAAAGVSAWALHRRAKGALEHQPRLHLVQSSASSLITQAGRVTGVTTWEGVERRAARTALCAGSFLGARLHVGSLTESAGRLSEMAYDDLYDDLRARGFGFEAAVLGLPEQPGALGYRVVCWRFAAAERAGFALPRLEGLFAAGVCASGYLSYEDAARQGQELAAALLR